MRQYAQWVVWRYEEEPGKDKPKKVPYGPHTGRHASVSDPSTWGSFEQAIDAAASGWFAGIGFVLTNNDPFGFIDLDDAHGDADAVSKQQKIFDNFVSYAERSPSEKGLHIIVKGSIPSGRKRSFVEVYSSARFMTMTGNVFRASPIVEYHELLNVLWDQIGKRAETIMYTGNAPQTEEDQAILQRACNAANGSKFQALLAGQWHQHYPSQSEADLAFINVVAFYTQSREQISRIFKASPLGARDKQTTIRGTPYIDYMINKSFDRLLPPVDIDHLRIQVEEAIERARMQEAQQAQQIYGVPDIEATAYDTPVAMVLPDATPQVIDPQPSNPIYSVPPGLIGEIARFIYEAAPRPVPEIALAGAIGLMAGVCGRAYNVSGTGVNQYVLLLARTGTGKEAIAKGIDKLIGAVTRTVPAAVDFIGPAEIASPQALTKYMGKQSKSFVSLMGEFGLYLKQLSAWNAPPHMLGLRRMLLDLYNKSGEGNVLRPSIYSDREKNTEAVLAPAFTMLGESTPEKFYEALDESMIAEGLLPRFTIIEYYGKRPELNEHHTRIKPSDELVHKMATLCAHAAMLNNANKTVGVRYSEEADAMFKEFNLHCDDQMRNNDTQEVVVQLWNRAHIKALKLAALIAVGVNPYDPVISADVATWATNLIVADVRNLLKRFERGDIGVETAETKQADEVIKAFRNYVLKDFASIEKYKINKRMHADRVIPHRYIVQVLSSFAAFRNDRIGSTNAIKRALETLKAQGDIVQLLPSDVMKKYEFNGVCYGIAQVESFGFE
jgi:hypothetical protein